VQDWGGPIGFAAAPWLREVESTVLLDGARHYIGEDAPAEIVAAVRNWPAGQSVP
jgi:hypothetical protein